MDIRQGVLAQTTARIKFDITTVLGTENRLISSRTVEDRTGRDPGLRPRASDPDILSDLADRKEIVGLVAPLTTIHNTAPKPPKHPRRSETERIHPEGDEEMKILLISIITKTEQPYDSTLLSMDRTKHVLTHHV